MPRRPRVFVEGGIYHVSCRTARRAPVLAGECEAQRFLDVARELTPRDRLAPLAWCLMPNHHHLVRRTAEVPLWRSMRRIAGALRPVPQAPPLHPRQPVAGALQGVDHRHPGIPRARPGLRSPQPGDRGAREAPRGVAASAGGERARLDVATYLQRAAAVEGVENERLGAPCRDRATVRTRQAAVLLGVERYGLRCRELAAAPGRSANQVSRWAGPSEPAERRRRRSSGGDWKRSTQRSGGAALGYDRLRRPAAE